MSHAAHHSILLLSRLSHLGSFCTQLHTAVHSSRSLHVHFSSIFLSLAGTGGLSCVNQCAGAYRSCFASQIVKLDSWNWTNASADVENEMLSSVCSCP